MPQSVEQRKTAYAGAAGELRAASELSLRGYIVHIPLVDEGGDLWALAEDAGNSFRVQVKTAVATNLRRSPGNVSLQINFKGGSFQVAKQMTLVLHSIFDRAWHTIVMNRDELAAIAPGGLPEKSGQKSLWFIFLPNGAAFLGGVKGPSLSRYVDAWDRYFPNVPSTGALK
jgi:hypothetical protein